MLVGAYDVRPSSTIWSTQGPVTPPKLNVKKAIEQHA